MEPYSTLKNNLDKISYSTIRTNKKVTYLNLACGFDIETTSFMSGDNKLAHMYIWAISIGHGNGVFYGRTWEEFIDLCETLQTHFHLSEDRLLVIYVHNLGYEFQFMRKYFNWKSVFAVGERKPIKAICDYGIEFRDSYILSGFSLAVTAKNLTSHKVSKLSGSLDYFLVRHHKTELTSEELQYCKNDVLIITAYITEQLDIYGDINKIPLTNTGRVRKFVRNNCYYSSSNHRKSSKSKYYRYRNIMKDLTLDVDTYIQLKRGFMGGYTHANAKYVGEVLNNVSSIDFTSSYPSVMVSEKFPMSRFKKITIKSLKHFKECRERYAMIFDIKFIGLESIAQECYISESKCYNLKKPVINNGRIVSADLLTTTLTEVDFDIMQQCYKWESIELSNVKYAHKAFLPKAIIKSVLELYQDKTVLKGVAGSEVEYLLSKGMLNSIYGMCVTDIVKDNAIYTGEWKVEKADIVEGVEKYNGSKNRFLYYAWGVWVTAYARRNLWTGIMAIGDDYIYSDTDSLKVLNYDKHVGYINWFNKQILNKIETVCNYYGFDTELITPRTKEGVEKPLGVWDYEGLLSRFKTLGAKRYLSEWEGKTLEITVAGLSKQNGLKYMLKTCNGDNTKVFDMFNDSLTVPAEETGKMTHTYIDDELLYKCVDYKGNSVDIKALSSIHLSKCEFTLSLSKQYLDFLNNLSKGYLYQGVKLV